MPTRVILFAIAGLAVFTSRAPADAPKADEAYQNALVAALHRLSESTFDAEHLAVFLEKHPKLVNERVKHSGRRKPLTTDHYIALHFAVRHGNSEAIKLLLAHKADVNADAGGGWTALHLAAQRGEVHLVKQLVEAGAKVNSKTDPLPGGAAPGGAPNVKPVILPAIPALTPLDLAKDGNHHAEVVKYLEGLK